MSNPLNKLDKISFQDCSHIYKTMQCRSYHSCSPDLHCYRCNYCTRRKSEVLIALRFKGVCPLSKITRGTVTSIEVLLSSLPTLNTYLSEDGCYQSRQALWLGLPFHRISRLKRGEKGVKNKNKDLTLCARLCVCVCVLPLNLCVCSPSVTCS